MHAGHDPLDITVDNFSDRIAATARSTLKLEKHGGKSGDKIRLTITAPSDVGPEPELMLLYARRPGNHDVYSVWPFVVGH